MHIRTLESLCVDRNETDSTIHQPAIWDLLAQAFCKAKSAFFPHKNEYVN